MRRIRPVWIGLITLACVLLAAPEKTEAQVFNRSTIVASGGGSATVVQPRGLFGNRARVTTVSPFGASVANVRLGNSRARVNAVSVNSAHVQPAFAHAAFVPQVNVLAARSFHQPAVARVNVNPYVFAPAAVNVKQFQTFAAPTFYAPSMAFSVRQQSFAVPMAVQSFSLGGCH